MIPRSFLPENQCFILNYAEWHFLHFVHLGHFRKFLKCTKCTKCHMFFYFACVFVVFSFHLSVFSSQRDSELLLKEHLNTCKKSMLLFYFPLNCFSHINKKNNTLLLEQIVLKDLAPLSLPYFLAASKSFLRNAIFISCVLIHLPPSS